MIIKSRPLSIFNLLHFDFKSVRFHPAVSSIYIFASLSFSIASQILANSSSVNSHFANFQEFIPIAEAIILSVSCSLLISSEKIATFFLLYQIF
jgi:hypothetical protein